MIDLETLKKIQSASIQERIDIIEAILRSIKQEMPSPSQPSHSEPNPLRGKVIHYEDPYEPVSSEDWEVLA
jgi:hypothetical protein